MEKKILVIDDDEQLLQILCVGLSDEGFDVTTASSSSEGLKAAFYTHPDLVLLDIMMQNLDGLEVCRRLKELSSVPVIMLTARATVHDIVKGLEAGADDYVTKPFAMDELIARIRVGLRHGETSGDPTRPAVIVCGRLTIDLARRRVAVDGRPVNLTPTEFRLLSYLARHPGQVIPHRILLAEVWGSEYDNQIQYLQLYMLYLRRKIEENPSRPEIVKTERGVGYYLECEERKA